MRRYGVYFLFCTLFVAALLAASAARAERPTSSEGALEEMIVTAKREPQAVGSLAGNIARLTAEDIDFIRAAHPSEALGRLPGVLIHRGSGLEHLTSIRSPVLVGDDGAGSFLFLEDGVPLRAAGFANVNGLFEAHTELAGAIEVVRGPGSAFYGSNALHGLVNVLTRAPSEAARGYLDLSGGSYGRVSGRGYVSSSRSRHGIFAGLTLAHEDGFREAASLDYQKLTIRNDLSLPQASVRLTLSATNLNQETAGFVEGPDAYKHDALARANASPEAFRDAKSVRLASRIEMPVAGGTLALTPFARWNMMAFLLHFFPSKALEENGHWSLGGLSIFSYPLSGGHEVALGFDGEYTKGYLRETQSLPTIGSFTQGVHYDYAVTARVLAPFVHTEWEIAQRLRATAGLRLEHTAYDYDNRTETGLVGRFLRPADRRDAFLTLTPKLGLVYAWSERVALYVSAAQGTRAPQASELYRLQSRQTVGGLEPQKLDSLELGARGSVDGLVFSLAVYAMRKRNFFFRDADGFNVPDGRTRHYGFEWELSLPLRGWLDVVSSGAYARHAYAFSRPVLSSATESIAEGNDVDTAPHLIASTRLVLKPVPAVRAELEWSHVGAYFTDAANSHTYPGHDVLGLRLSVTSPRGLKLYAAVRNLTNTDYAERADFAFGTERYFPGENRNYMLGLSVTL